MSFSSLLPLNVQRTLYPILLNRQLFKDGASRTRRVGDPPEEVGDPKPCRAPRIDLDKPDR